jgi:serine/threonine protein kinase
MAMAAVAHPHLATIYGIELWRGIPLLIVEYFSETLHDRLRRGPLRPNDAIQIGIDLAEALEALHTSGILHRDVKPSNIGFTASGTPKLLDFGLAKVVRHTRAGQEADSLQTTASAGPPDQLADSVSSPLQMIGTPLYLSPETVQLKPPDAGVDLWALALIIYESIAGRHPMRAPTVTETMMRIAKAQAPDVREHRPECPPALATFLQQALHADRRRRPATARAFRLELQGMLERALAS